jgi:hypothetical protein
MFEHLARIIEQNCGGCDLMSTEVLAAQQWLHSTYGSNPNYIYVSDVGATRFCKPGLWFCGSVF